MSGNLLSNGTFVKGGVDSMEIQKMLDDYAQWIKSEITFQKCGEYYEITTPFLDNANDYLQFYVKQEDDCILFSDDGMTIENLEMTGLQFAGTRKKQLLQILQRYGVDLDRKELVSKVHASLFPQAKHKFVQAMLCVNDMFMVSKGKVTSYFLEDIMDFFDSNEIFYTENVQFVGVSGYAQIFDYVIQRSKHNPERLCKAINSATKQTLESTLFIWQDIKPVRKQDSSLVVIINDGNPITRGVEEGFLNYGAKIIKWSERNNPENVKLLSA